MTNNETAESSQVRRVAVIGAGQSGLCVIRHFAADPAYEVVAFEQQDRTGGLWNYPQGCEELGTVEDDQSPYFCRMHRNLKTNSTKHHQVYEGGLSMEEQMDLFPTRQMICDYLTEYAKAHNVLKHIKMRHVVKSIIPLDDAQSTGSGLTISNQRWKVTVTDLALSFDHEETFDVVIICSGECTSRHVMDEAYIHTADQSGNQRVGIYPVLLTSRQYRKMYVPYIPTLENFHGTVLHSGDFRHRETYKGQNILLIGASVSANDLTCELYGVGNRLFVVRRRFHDAFADRQKFPNIFPFPEPLHFTADGFILDNGQVQLLDSVILCTGYMFNFPFLSRECGIQFNRGHAWPLYRHMINCDHPTMAFIGCIQKSIPVVPVVECQVRYYKSWLDRVFPLPSSEAMKDECQADYAERLADGMPEHRAHAMKPTAQRLYPYLDSLAKEAEFKPWGTAMRQMFLATCKNQSSQPCNWRNSHYEIVDNESIQVNRTEV